MEDVGYEIEVEAFRVAAIKLAEELSLEVKPLERQQMELSYLIASEDFLNLPGNGESRYFKIYRHNSCTVFTGDRPASVLAGVMYYVDRKKKDMHVKLPLTRISPFLHRLIIEDFPFMCYQPTGFDFDTEKYAENLAALGFTAMECNRFSKAQPMEAYHWNYAFTNPSPSYFVWTKWHEGVWDKRLIDANATELADNIRISLEHGLEPSLTTFLPRPYPEAFFMKHPQFRGPEYSNPYMQSSGHPEVYCLDTDNPEVLNFYHEVYAKLFDRYPQIGHLFFWHADLGTTFWPDGQGSTRRWLVDRVAEFQRMIFELLNERGMQTRVWMNPWALPENCLDGLNDTIPTATGFAIKDNVGTEGFAGTTPIRYPDANIVTAILGDVPKNILQLAADKGRDVCLSQYQDFSEDLDPVISVPHPIMTFRKFQMLKRTGVKYSSLNWGAISPDVAPVNPNQDVIREMTWGHEAEVFSELLPDILPPMPHSSADKIYDAWRKVDYALQIWPQHWGLRLQDSGLRLRWLVRPFGFDMNNITASQAEYYLANQIYDVNHDTPFQAFMNISAEQAWEISVIYGDMIKLLKQAEEIMRDAADDIETDAAIFWTRAQTKPLKMLRLFWTTYRNMLGFTGLRELCGMADMYMPQLMKFVEDEITNVEETRSHLAANPHTIIIADYPWGQCFGKKLDQDLQNKQYLMKLCVSILTG